MSSPLPPFLARLIALTPQARLIETHISWVLLTGDRAYKLKKPVDLGFLDFSSLDKRRFYCQEEVRLNRRLAPDTYLDVIPVTGPEEAPQLDGSGPVLEWAVRMRAFTWTSTLDRADTLVPAQLDAIADRIAAFHQAIPQATPESAWGTAAAVVQPVRKNFAQIRDLSPPAPILAQLAALEPWAEAESRRLADHFARRQAQGFVRECHGDLHLGNIAWADDAPLIFDCIEFNPALRWIDVMNEVAFLAMDLVHRGYPHLAWRAVNRYLEHTGDYAGLAALHYYLVYRAMVRAKVAAIRAAQSAGAEGSAYDECAAYLDLALAFTRPDVPGLVLMHGVSGSGKTHYSQALLEGLPAIRLRSDVERKRLFGLATLADSAQVPGGIYTPAAGERTRQRLLDLAAGLLDEGFLVVVDATFIDPVWRAPFVRLAADHPVPWCWVSPQVTPADLRQRVARRAALGTDASEAGLEVLEAQLAHQTPLDADETARSVQPLPSWPGERLIQAVAACLQAPSRPDTHP